jgi:hypothetical protein
MGILKKYSKKINYKCNETKVIDKIFFNEKNKIKIFRSKNSCKIRAKLKLLIKLFF